MSAALASNPAVAYESLREEDRELLALVAAHSDASDGRPLPWRLLNEYVDQIAKSESDKLQLVEILSRRGLPKRLALLANHLINAQLLTPQPDGLKLSEEAKGLRGDWNGAFAALVGQARLVVDRAV